ncbi:tripartite tricarboxylate transporter TctB family protein [Aliagarivorans marinus]|uniref:tripartite tricarboxylate transporter TctB family protein n=1 Tax=Aliagarivorans marinus TaxID=561965 RepID=UPI0003F91CE5|nr:tripartite tricarboxylate transporter TctB family protein [Aliagarivorans marinus]
MRFWFSVSSLVFALGFTLYGWQTLELHDFNGRPGPGYFPLIIGLGLTVCTAINVFKDLRTLRSSSGQLATSGVDGGADAASPRFQKDTLAVAVCITLLIVALNSLGAIISMMVFCLAFLSYFNRGKTLQNISYSIIFPMCVYLLFDVWLQAGLPDGLLRHFY